MPEHQNLFLMGLDICLIKASASFLWQVCKFYYMEEMILQETDKNVHLMDNAYCNFDPIHVLRKIS